MTISGGGVVEERRVSLVVEGTTTQQQGTVPQTTSSQVVVTGTASPPTGDFTLEVVPSSISLQRGGSGSVAITVRSVGGFAGEVELSATGLPPGTSYYFSCFKPNTRLQLINQRFKILDAIDTSVLYYKHRLAATGLDSVA